jgi:hypothetical protein
MNIRLQRFLFLYKNTLLYQVFQLLLGGKKLQPPKCASSVRFKRLILSNNGDFKAASTPISLTLQSE